MKLGGFGPLFSFLSKYVIVYASLSPRRGRIEPIPVLSRPGVR